MSNWEEIYAYWFGAPGSPAHGEVRDFWFGGGPEIDREITDRFAGDYALAVAGGCDGWKSIPRACVALIVLLDQFPRNMFRGEAKSFASDSRALATAKSLVGSPAHDTLIAVEKVFTYLPFEHSENADDQARSVALYEAMDDHEKKAEWVDFAVQHKVIVDRFGRFPHRNAILGRESTVEETDWLASSDQHFGTVAEGDDCE